MKATIYVKRFKDESGKPKVLLPEIIDKGDWIDLRAAQEIVFKAPQSKTIKYKNIDGKKQGYYTVSQDLQLIPLGIAMKLPKGYEAMILPRSSTPKGMGIICANSEGVIDGPNPVGYCGNNDEWKFPAIALRDTTIKQGERICQFRIQLSQKATVLQKIKWLFTSGVRIIEVESLESPNRGGFGTSGVK